MTRRGRGALGGAAAAWVLVAGCGGDRSTVAAGPDSAMRRELRLAAATTVALAAAPPDTGAARFLPAVELAPRAGARADAPAPRPRRRLAARAVKAHVVAAAPAAPADVEPAVLAASTEPQPERMARFADQEGVSGYAAGYGVALRGGAVGDDHCERDRPRRTPFAHATVTYRPATVRLGGPAMAPHPGAGPLAAPPF